MCEMSLTDMLTIIALLLNFVALGIVAYQTYLNRKSLQVAKQSIDEVSINFTTNYCSTYP